jgi:hypothetical protein
VIIPITPPGSSPNSPTATDGSGASTDAFADADAAPPMSDLDVQKEWRLLDWGVALFLCSSLVQFLARRNIAATISGCGGIAAATTYLWWRRWLQGAGRGSCAKALEQSMGALVAFQWSFAAILGMISGFSYVIR